MRRIATFLITIAAMLGIFTVPSHAADYNPLVSGHRGVVNKPAYPENTMAAFGYAKRQGVDVIEFDIYWTKATPGNPSYMVVIHDPTLDRTTNGSGYVIDKTWAQIRTVDAGNGQRVPLFRDVIIFAKKHGLRMNSEIKGNISASKPSRTESTITNAQADRYIAVLEKYDMTNRNVMSSASRSVIRKIQANDTNRRIETALIAYSGDSLDEAASYGDSYMPTWSEVNRAEVAELKSQGVDTYIWPIKTKADFEKAYATRAAVLVTDIPMSVTKWLEEK